MSFSNFLRRAKSSLRFWGTSVSTDTGFAEFQIDEVSARVAKLQAPTAVEPQPFHALVKLAPISVPRKVRRESQAIYMGAWAGTAILAGGSFYVPSEWLLWYGAIAVLIFAILFRLEGPYTRVERLQREHEVLRCHAAYLEAEAELKVVLSEGYNERLKEFNSLRTEYDDACRALDVAEPGKTSKLLSALANPLRVDKTQEDRLLEQMEEMEIKMLQLVDELEDYSDTHKEKIDAAIMARHNARLAYWQARLDEAALTGEIVQQH